jgi:hypothetical protein
MAASTPLTGIELIDCAKANAKQGLETTAQLCGYGDHLQTFKDKLQSACHDIGVEISELNDLITDQQTVLQQGGIEVAPDTPSEL